MIHFEPKKPFYIKCSYPDSFDIDTSVNIDPVELGVAGTVERTSSWDSVFTFTGNTDNLYTQVSHNS